MYYRCCFTWFSQTPNVKQKDRRIWGTWGSEWLSNFPQVTQQSQHSNVDSRPDSQSQHAMLPPMCMKITKYSKIIKVLGLHHQLLAFHPSSALSLSLGASVRKNVMTVTSAPVLDAGRAPSFPQLGRAGRRQCSEAASQHSKCQLFQGLEIPAWHLVPTAHQPWQRMQCNSTSNWCLTSFAKFAPVWPPLKWFYFFKWGHQKSLGLITLPAGQGEAVVFNLYIYWGREWIKPIIF